ncbi:hypothetical protein MPTK1_2g10130 [Marchantia polymorpha subsp. ruderalis]|uniref:Uncharacterized protein n=1 Tax=Marchantia polymorpha TaxID=3197 RepID=A0A2R6W8G2_MARPO|nr:hypothetical protein MARPO_0129s0037 [Marchantia polymorpha]BBN01767.1 hypothetical protein Mp_2g10130 [Marchantia polymorpha subsp. ruderalis]|eukprot:PTQ30150.1 hypothetical protein MARPO_0129s0037 [Marchantia polymorpha]
MLPDGGDMSLQTEAMGSASRSSMKDFFANIKSPSSKKADVDMPSEFGEYQPSFLSAPKRIPLAGRRRSPIKVRSFPEATESLEKHPEAPVKTTYKGTDHSDVGLWYEKAGTRSDADSCKVNEVSGHAKGVEKKTLSSGIASAPVHFAGDIHSTNDILSLELPTTPSHLEGPSNLGPDISRPLGRVLDGDSFVSKTPSAGVSNRKESPSRTRPIFFESERDRFVEPQEALEYEEHFKQLSLGSSSEKMANNNTPHPTDSNRIISATNIPHVSISQNSAEIQRPAEYTKDEDGLNVKEKTFCDLLLAERNTLQSKLDIERDKFLKEKETLQVRFSEESLRLQREIQLLTCANEKTKGQRDSLVIEVSKLREENMSLKDEILRVENERLAFEKKTYESEQSHQDILLNKVEGEREEAQRLAAQLTSEVQLLKSSSLLAEEKMTYLCKLHDQELQMMKTLHRQELEVKSNQFEIEKKLWSDHETTINTVRKLLDKGDEWALKVDTLHGVILSAREDTSNDKTVWAGLIHETVDKGQAALREWGDHCNGIRSQFDQLLAVLETGGREIRAMHLEEKERLDTEHAHLKLLQEALQEERAQSLTDLAAAHERLEGMRNLCYVEKEKFLTTCMQEIRDISSEREEVVHMREQLLHAEAALQKQVMEHAQYMQAEASESEKKRMELERAKEMAAEIAHEVENARQELEQQRQAFEREIASIQAFGLQAQQKIDSAIEIQREAAQLKLDAECIQHESAREACEIGRQRIQTAMAQKELLELKRRHDEERMRLAMERQQLCAERKENDISCVLRESRASEGSVYSIYDSRSHVFDLSSWDKMPKMKQARQVAMVPTRAPHISSKTKSSLSSGPWIVESVEASLCLQAQEDFLAEASRVLQHTTQNTTSLLTKTIT